MFDLLKMFDDDFEMRDSVDETEIEQIRRRLMYSPESPQRWLMHEYQIQTSSPEIFPLHIDSNAYQPPTLPITSYTSTHDFPISSSSSLALEASSSSISRCSYHVYLSFRGDTRRTFTDHLYTALVQAGFRTFRDDDGIRRGENIKFELEKAIQESTISIIVFSNNYASSRWCLDELVKILSSGHFVLPVFYDVDPSDVRKQKGSFQCAFMKHEARFEAEEDHDIKNEWLLKVKGWRKALEQVSKLAGMRLQNQADRAGFIKGIIEVTKARTDKNHKRLSTYSKLELISPTPLVPTQHTHIVQERITPPFQRLQELPAEHDPSQADICNQMSGSSISYHDVLPQGTSLIEDNVLSPTSPDLCIDNGPAKDLSSSSMHKERLETGGWAFQVTELTPSAAYSTPSALMITEQGGILSENVGSSNDLRYLSPSAPEAFFEGQIPKSSSTRPALTNEETMKQVLQFLTESTAQHDLQRCSLEEERFVEIINASIDGRSDSSLQYIQVPQTAISPIQPETFPNGGEIMQLDSSEQQSSVELDAINIGGKAVSADKSFTVMSQSQSKKKNAAETRQRESGRAKTAVISHSAIRLEDLQPHFGQKRSDVADNLGVSVSTLKRICRKRGIDRWPYPKKNYECSLGSAQHNLSQKDASTHCGKVEPECVMELDYSSEFTTSKIFKNRDALIEWASAVGRKNGFVVVKRSDAGAGSKKPMITLGCESSCYYRDMRKNTELHQDKKLKRTDTEKCECPFELKGQKFDTNNDWTLHVICGKHNHHIVSHTTAEKGIASTQDAMWMTFYATYRDDTIKFQISSTSGINELKEKVARRLELEPGSFNVKYEDGGKLILIACDEALKEYVQEYVECSTSSLSNRLSLVVTDKVANSGSSCKKSRSGKGRSPAI